MQKIGFDENRRLQLWECIGMGMVVSLYGLLESISKVQLDQAYKSFQQHSYWLKNRPHPLNQTKSQCNFEFSWTVFLN